MLDALKILSSQPRLKMIKDVLWLSNLSLNVTRVGYSVERGELIAGRIIVS